jgi:hypothetical protein
MMPSVTKLKPGQLCLPLAALEELILTGEV